MIGTAKPQRERILVIGGVAAGMSAASRARKLKKEADILVFEKGGAVSYGSCGLPYFISGLIPSTDDLIAYSPQFFKEQRNIDIYLFHEVVQIEPKTKRINVKNLKTQTISEFEYDQLILATGARPVVPPIQGIDVAGIFKMRTLEDGQAMAQFIKENSPQNSLIVGAGYIGLEMAEALKQLGQKVTLIEKMPNILGNMDAEIFEMATAELTRQSIRVLTSTAVTEFISSQNKVRQAILSNGESVPVDLALVGAGIKPNVELAQAAGIALGKTGAIQVTPRMETNIENIYAAGDCAEAFHLVTQKPAYIPLGTTANKQGRIAGETAAGGKASFKGVVGTAVFKFFDLTIARTGLSEIQARQAGFSIVTGVIEQNSRAHYYPGGSKIRVKLIADKETRRLIGASMAGKEGIAKRIDVLATLIYLQSQIQDISDLDLSYAPPYGPVYDPILIALSELLKKLESP